MTGLFSTSSILYFKDGFFGGPQRIYIQEEKTMEDPSNAGQIRTAQRARVIVVSGMRQVVGTYLQGSLENLNRQSQKELTPIGKGGENISRIFTQNLSP